MTPWEKADQFAQALRAITGTVYLDFRVGDFRARVQVAEVWVENRDEKLSVTAMISTVGEPEMTAEPTGGWRE